VWYFALSQELIFWLKVHQKAGMCIYNFKIFLGGDIPGPDTHCRRWRRPPAPNPITAVSAMGMGKGKGGEAPPVLGHKP